MKTLNKCIDCAKFKKYRNLTLCAHPDSQLNITEIYYVCKNCYNKEKHQERKNIRRNQDENWLKKYLRMF